MIEITSYEPANQGKKIGYMDIRLPKIGMNLRRLAHFQNIDKRWVNFPTIAKDLPNGTKIFLPYADFIQQTHNTEFLVQLHEAMIDYCKKHNIKFPDPLDLSGDLGADLPF
jgi:hypothetical protein